MYEYESLVSKYNESQAECRQLKEQLSKTEAELKKLENALAPAVDEFNHLHHRYEIERECRTEAEKYASKMRKQNLDLKRRSQQILHKMQLVQISFDEDDESGDGLAASSDEDSRDVLNKKIQALEGTVSGLEQQIVTFESDKVEAYERETSLAAKVRLLEEELVESRQQLQDYHNEMKNLKRVSDTAWREFEELKAEHEQNMKLKSEAEKYAHQMLTERDAVKRESAILMQSAMSDERLAAALLSIEDLTAKLAKEERKVESLHNELDSSALVKRVSELEGLLDTAVSENDRLQKNVKDLEKWKEKLEKENVDLVNKLDVAEQKLRPPPPPPAPPPPPPSFFSPLRLFIKKKTPAANSATTKTQTPKDQTYEQALKEMMERIKSGHALKSTTVTEAKPMDTTDKQPSAMDDLQNLLSRRQYSVDELISRQKTQRKANESPTQTELMRTIQKVRPKGLVVDEATD